MLILEHDQQALFRKAIKNGNLVQLQALLASRKVEVKDVLLEGNHTLLHIAALKGQTDIMQFLIDQGVDINAKSADDKTALHCAVIKDDPEAAALLLEQDGVDCSIISKHMHLPNGIISSNGGSVFYLATSNYLSRSKNGRNVLIKILESDKITISNGAAVSEDETDWELALELYDHAVLKPDSEMLNLLVKKGITAIPQRDALSNVLSRYKGVHDLTVIFTEGAPSPPSSALTETDVQPHTTTGKNITHEIES